MSPYDLPHSVKSRQIYDVGKCRVFPTNGSCLGPGGYGRPFGLDRDRRINPRSSESTVIAITMEVACMLGWESGCSREGVAQVSFSYMFSLCVIRER